MKADFAACWQLCGGLRPGGAAAAWEQYNFVPTELLIEIELDRHCRVRIAAPGQSGWTNNGSPYWRVTSGTRLYRQLMTRPVRQVRATLLLVQRGLTHVLTELAECEVEHPAMAASWLGWPRAKEKAAIGEVLSARSNDYAALDLAARSLGLGRLDTGTASALPFSGGISIVIPARNVHDVLPDVITALERAVAQLPSGTPWEVLVVDDASNPPLQLPGRPSRSERIRLLRSEHQLHCGGARNYGAAHARHSLIVFCDADTHMAPNYLIQHVARHLLAPNLITVSLRDYVDPGLPVPDRQPDGSRDSRVTARYEPGRLGLTPVQEPITVYPLQQTRNFRDFGNGRLLGPVDLPFMVKGNNLAIYAEAARTVGFPPEFVGWGPEDVCFAAKAIARGTFVVPVLSTGVFHCQHPPRSGSIEQRDAELMANLDRYARRLSEPAWESWQHGDTHVEDTL